MKYWDVDYPHAEKRITMNRNAHQIADRIFSITKDDDGEFSFEERCDDHFEFTVSKEKAIAILEEALLFVKQSE